MENGQRVAGYVYITPDTYGDVLSASVKLDTLIRTIADNWIDNADKAWMPEPPESVLALIRVWVPELYRQTKQKVDEIKAEQRAKERTGDGDGILNDG